MGAGADFVPIAVAASHCYHDASPIPIKKWTGEFIAVLPFLGAFFALLPFTQILSSLLNPNQMWVWGPMTHSNLCK